jgi:hypothetical protein
MFACDRTWLEIVVVICNIDFIDQVVGSEYWSFLVMMQ